jgi:TIR domain
MRDMLFLSHANPEDNEVTQWLALQLAREGYPVWCDLTKLLGGEAFWNDVQQAIRERTVKFLFVLSRASNSKPGALNELELASKVQRRMGLKDFIIPLWLDDLPTIDFDIRVTSTNAIPFGKGWARGLAQLLKKLEEDAVPKKPGFDPAAVSRWWREHASAATGLQDKPDLLVTNWYPLAPALLHFHELSGSGMGPIELPRNLPKPGVRHNQYLVSFAPAEAFTEGLGPDLSIRSTLTRQIGGTEADEVARIWSFKDERHAVTQLLRETWLGMVKSRGMPTYEFANKAAAFYFPKDHVPGDKIWFTGVDGNRSRRSMVGYKTIHRTGVPALRYWHFALQAKPTTTPVLGYTFKPHVLFSDDGEQIWTSAERLHRARRTQCRNWWNDKWRDLIAAAASWLANDAPFISVPVHGEIALQVAVRPLGLESPISFVEPSELPDQEALDVALDDDQDDWAEEDEPTPVSED